MTPSQGLDASLDAPDVDLDGLLRAIEHRVMQHIEQGCAPGCSHEGCGTKDSASYFEAEEKLPKLLALARRALAPEAKESDPRVSCFDCGVRTVLMRGTKHEGLLMGYRCTDCGEVFCGTCAQKHFFGEPETSK